VGAFILEGAMKRHTAKKIVTPAVDERLLTSKELLQRVPLHRATIWKLVQQKRFPAPIQITANRIVWRWSSVLEWLTALESNPIEARPYFGRKRKTAEQHAEAG
jgi:predicted DNA-binding transcriptional regulator AlpA